MNYSQKTYTINEAKKKIEGYCAYQERCHLEVTTKLRTMRMIPEAIDLITTHLIQNDFLNEERFSRSYARGKFNVKNWGKGKIVSELKRRNIEVVEEPSINPIEFPLDFVQSLSELY